MNVTALQSLIGTLTTGIVEKNVGVQSGTVTTSAQTNATKDAYSSKLAEIASKYDVKNITPRQVQTMSKELYDNGLISLLSYGVMSLHYVKPDFSASNPGELDRPDEPRDMLADFKYMASYQKTAEQKKNAQDLVDELELISSLSHDKNRSSKFTAPPQSAVDAQAAASSYADAISQSTANTQNVVKVLEALTSYSQSTSSSGKS